jgi:hypothetical protein
MRSYTYMRLRRGRLEQRTIKVRPHRLMGADSLMAALGFSRIRGVTSVVQHLDNVRQGDKYGNQAQQQERDAEDV